MPSTLHVMAVYEGQDLEPGQELVNADCGHEVIANPHTVKLLQGEGPHTKLCFDCFNHEL